MSDTFYPHMLSGSKYKQSVCEYIYASLEGAKTWNAPMISNMKERTAYIETFEMCQELCYKYNLRPNEMSKALRQLQEDLRPLCKPGIFSHWFDNTPEYQEYAFKHAIELVEGITNRFMF